ncbi:MAG: WbqC family protein [Bacteroidia bacterium]
MIRYILPCLYMGPVQYYSKLASGAECIIELDEHFRKQTFQSRAVIYDANGSLKLIIPLMKHREKTALRDICISYDAPWQNLHWKSMESAYRSSPFFEYYEHEFINFYIGNKWKYLIDYNLAIQEVILKLLKLNPLMTHTTRFEKEYVGAIECRDLFSFKKNTRADPDFVLKPYNQVFEPKHGFIPNLSIVDLLFNEGPESKTILIDPA